MSKSRNFHVVPSRDGRWKAIRTGAERASAVFDTQREAISYARQRAREEHGELFIHGRDGRIRERDSYGNDPFPPRG
ncbi:MAG: hypothetical protein BAA04_09685 [Firmicutes bacterium ZCTH02-B6]|nr:MAG: hypothetical protein BAA04_09685 [Firmicutes bacterium ZCTH02-B6]